MTMPIQDHDRLVPTGGSLKPLPPGRETTTTSPLTGYDRGQGTLQFHAGHLCNAAQQWVYCALPTSEISLCKDVGVVLHGFKDLRPGRYPKHHNLSFASD